MDDADATASGSAGDGGESVLAEQLRNTIGRLVRTTRTVDTLPPGEAAILGYLDREGPQTAAELAQRRAVSHQSAARSAKELLGDGLIGSGPHPTDGRKVLLYITAEGRERLHGERHARADRLADAIRRELSPQEREVLEQSVRLLSRLEESLRHDRAR